MTSDAALAASVAVAVALAVSLIRRTPGRLTRWSRHKVSSRVLGVLVGVALSLATTWMAGRGFKPVILGAAVAAGFYTAGEGQLVARAVDLFMRFYSEYLRSKPK